MGNLKISMRLTIAFGAMVLLLVALGAMVMVRSADQRELMKDITERRIPIMRALGDISEQLNLQARLARNMVLFTNEADIRTERDRMAPASAAIGERFKVLEALIVSDKGKEALARVAGGATPSASSTGSSSTWPRRGGAMRRCSCCSSVPAPCNWPTCRRWMR
jgi:methyl-accepting chemotaxis protein